MLIKKCGLIIFYFLEDRAHEGLAYEAAAVGDVIPLAETIEGTLLLFVKQDGDSIFARCFHLKIECEFGSVGDEVTPGFMRKIHAFYGLCYFYIRLLEACKEDSPYCSLGIDLASVSQIHTGIDTAGIVFA